MTIYLAVVDWDYEGSQVEGVYGSLTAASDHRWEGGDRHRIERWVLKKNGVGKRTNSDVFSKPRKKAPPPGGRPL